MTLGQEKRWAYSTIDEHHTGGTELIIKYQKNREQAALQTCLSA